MGLFKRKDKPITDEELAERREAQAVMINMRASRHAMDIRIARVEGAVRVLTSRNLISGGNL